jgi:stearoyl-CoA desaturase (delta-9 desaturase)
MHHEYSDTEHDPHSPHFFKDVYQMMMSTVKIYKSFINKERMPEEKFTADYLPVWESLDRFGNNNIIRGLFIVFYTWVYVVYAPNYWFFLLLPIHYLMGPIQGAIVNWCGHKYGYRNYESEDQSKNSTPWGVVLMGELFQNNHHHNRLNANFARKWYEFDLTYQIMRMMNFAGIIKINKG